MDIPILPSVGKGLSMAISLDNDNRFDYSSDIRSLDEQNGVWSVSISSGSDPGPVQFSAAVDGPIPPDISVAVLDIQSRKIYKDVLVNPFTIDARLNLVYELKFVVGDRKDYDWTKEKIDEYSLNAKWTVLISPVFGEMNLDKLAEWILQDNLDVRLQFQMHKYIWNPDMRAV